jgi:25S rRNA (uracil2843-N3)-methyltransferase
MGPPGKFDRQANSRPKHGKPTDSGASRAPAPPPNSRPLERGEGRTKKAPPKKPQPPQNPAPNLQNNILPVDLQQLILDIFRATFPASQEFADLKPLLSQINEALLQGSYEKAFQTEESREAYAIRWSSSRALVLANVLEQVCDEHGECPWVRQLLGDGGNALAKVLCFGGGAADIMAMAGLLRHRRADAAGRPSAASSPSSPPPNPLLDLHLIDAADWSGVVSKLTTGLATPPELSKYASAAARARNVSFLSPQSLRTRCTQTQILDSVQENLQSLIDPDVTLVTLLFTLNDLYTTSIRRATSFLLKLSAAVPKGCLLLVVDAHNASSTADGIEDAQAEAYPMSWLLDRALLPKQEMVDDALVPKREWEKMMGDTNRLFKFPEKGLSYPAGLENLKMQVHLFRRI